MKEKKRNSIWLWIIIIVIAVFAYKNAQEKKNDTKKAVPAYTVSATKTVSNTLGAVVTPTVVPRAYPYYIPDGALVIDGTEDSREYDYLLEKALADREPDFWIKNRRINTTEEFRELNYGTFWLSNWSCVDFGPDDSRGIRDSYQHLFIYYHDYSDEEIARMKREIDDAARIILNNIPDGADTWQKLLSIHDQLIATITFDQTLSLPHIRDPYGALVRREAVCVGYASAFSHLIRLVDIPSEVSFSDDHAWTHVWMSSPESYIDVTWDDPDVTDRYGNPYILHDYFLITFDELRQIDQHAFTSDEKDYYNNNYGDTALYTNYHMHEGYVVNSDDIEDIVKVFKRQMGDSNVVTVRFLNENDYLTVRNWDQQKIWDVLSRLGHKDWYYCWYNDVVHTFSLGLYCREGG